MGKGPGFYTDIGKKARDLLYKDYEPKEKLTITCYSATGVLMTTITIDEAAPGLETIFSFRGPHQRSELELQYLHDFAGISTSIGLTENPIVSFSGLVGTNVLSLGTDVSFYTKLGTVSKCNAGLSFTKADLIASLHLKDKGNTLSSSYYHALSPVTNTIVGAEVAHSLSTKENTITAGIQHQLDQQTTVKASVNNFGKATALLQQEWCPKFLFTILGEIDTKATKAIYGLALAIGVTSPIGMMLVLWRL
ncbi:mitochondrial outer membrane protein porin of 34 kDa-like isoform X2 [Lycium ferocissimum]|uniref:mitochondrial outer membrane protein porin of 34 kDa-like isoform X2 n=1 Tax=Lycium ferocissimum TaxID=112874 RepID=UPI002814F288|nr:mitochondrial outer membrane protein porin of 34 kDa-like isoform X2 [Lycium ferocissimum]